MSAAISQNAPPTSTHSPLSQRQAHFEPGRIMGGSIDSPTPHRHPAGIGPLVIDTDPGIDDVVTLALAARSPELDLIAVTTSYGNAMLDASTRNAHEGLRLAGRPDVPVYPGALRPLVRDLVTAPETHGESGVGYAPVSTRLSSLVSGPPDPAVLTALSRATAPVTLVTLGPLTNLALALERDERLARARIARHIGMFGT
ncbi:MAG: nucleoside hydrolase, partial [Gemmatimonadetes bacterium]|nr:nucleoside hydrolase [Gemmatimonadota bacterium]